MAGLRWAIQGSIERTCKKRDEKEGIETDWVKMGEKRERERREREREREREERERGTEGKKAVGTWGFQVKYSRIPSS